MLHLFIHTDGTMYATPAVADSPPASTAAWDVLDRLGLDLDFRGLPVAVGEGWAYPAHPLVAQQPTSHVAVERP